MFCDYVFIVAESYTQTIIDATIRSKNNKPDVTDKVKIKNHNNELIILFIEVQISGRHKY